EVSLLAVEGAIDDIAGVGQRGSKLAIEIGVVFDDEQAQGYLRSASVDEFAVRGVNGFADHSATVPEQSQHIDEPVAMMAKPGAHQIGVVAVLAPRSDGLSERDGLFIGDRGTLFGLVQAGV